MAKYKKILVAYDGSPSSRTALQHAFRLAAWIKVVAVIPEFQGELNFTGIGNIKEVMLGPGRQLLAEASGIAKEAGHCILTDLAQGEPYERIVQVAAEENCDCILMGRKGQHHVELGLMGGVTARVIGHTRKDVLVVPKEADLAWNHILLATDGSVYSSAAVECALALAKEHGTRLTAVSAVYVNDEFSAQAPDAVRELVDKASAGLEVIRAQGQESGVEVGMVVKEGEPHEVITDLAAELGIDLVVMGSHGRKGLSRLLMGSVTERVIGFAGCPVLVRHLQ